MQEVHFVFRFCLSELLNQYHFSLYFTQLIYNLSALAREYPLLFLHLSYCDLNLRIPLFPCWLEKQLLRKSRNLLDEVGLVC